MKPSPFSIFLDLSRLSMEANMVIGMRMMKLAAGGPKAISESQLMVSEKIQTSARIASEGAVALATGKSLNAIGTKSIASYRKVVKANRKRLAK